LKILAIHLVFFSSSSFVLLCSNSFIWTLQSIKMVPSSRTLLLCCFVVFLVVVNVYADPCDVSSTQTVSVRYPLFLLFVFFPHRFFPFVLPCFLF
jgi:hypothetical protein